MSNSFKTPQCRGEKGNLINMNAVVVKKSYPKKAPNSRRVWECPACFKEIGEPNRQKHIDNCNRTHGTNYKISDWKYLYTKEVKKTTAQIIDQFEAVIKKQTEENNSLKTQVSTISGQMNAMKKEIEDYKKQILMQQNKIKNLQERVSTHKKDVKPQKASEEYFQALGVSKDVLNDLKSIF